MPIATTVMPGTADVVHLVSNPAKQAQKGVAGQATDRAKAEAKGKIAEAKQQAHEGWQKLTAPGKMQRLKEFAVAQSPYRRQYVQPGTRFVAELDAPLDFGTTTRTSEQLAVVGSEPVPDSTLKARLVAEVSSATATRGTPVTAVLTEPLYSPTHQLILPADSRLIGEVLQAKSARKLHRNGELRVIFERIETSEEGVQALAQLQKAQGEQLQAAQSQAGQSQAMIGNLEGVEVDRRAHMELDEEGGAHATDSKTRYLSNGDGGSWGADGGWWVRISVDRRLIEPGGKVHSRFGSYRRIRRFHFDLREFSFTRPRCRFAEGHAARNRFWGAAHEAAINI
jgi:hypothetical protein